MKQLFRLNFSCIAIFSSNVNNRDPEQLPLLASLSWVFLSPKFLAVKCYTIFYCSQNFHHAIGNSLLNSIVNRFLISSC